MQDMDGLCLAEAMHPADALFQHRGVPGLIHVENRRGVLKIRPDAAGIGGKETPGNRLLLEIG